MCGIVGIVDFQQKTMNDKVLDTMLHVQRHRGPDYTGKWLNDNVALGHNRLSIIDLSERGHQPMFSADKSVAIVFNGEIYNFKSLRNELLEKGYQFDSDTDTEVIIYGYKAYGVDIVKRLNGMFAFCIYDISKKLFFLARDRFGQKPLFYYFDGNRFLFASELKTILAYPEINKEVDHNALDLFLSLQYIPAPYSIYKKIRQLQASEYVILKDKTITTQNYYDIQVDDSLKNISFQDAQQLLRRKVNEAVQQRTIADVPLGSFLSGGIDSSIISALLAQNTTKPITTISVGFDVESYSETPKARTIAEKYNTNHHEYILDLNEAKQNVENIISFYDQPFGDSSAIPTYYLSQVARQNVTVALSGDGGDELFAGYQRYHLDRKFNSIQQIIPAFLLHPLLSVLRVIPPRKNVPIERNYLLGLKRLQQVAKIDKRASILRWGSYFNFMQKQQLYKNYDFTSDKAVDYLINLYERRNISDDYTLQTQYADIFSYAPGDYLVKTDIASMQHALEVRCPLLDYELVNLVFSLPPAYSRNKSTGKHIFKETFKNDLTDKVLYGPKQGFSIPSAEWFKGAWLNILRDYLNSSQSFCKQYFNSAYIEKIIKEHQQNRDDHSKRMYLLLVLEVWNRNQRG